MLSGLINCSPFNGPLSDSGGGSLCELDENLLLAMVFFTVALSRVAVVRSNETFLCGLGLELATTLSPNSALTEDDS